MAEYIEREAEMDVREKLVELIGSTGYGNGSLVGNNFQKGFIEKIATHLIANGVTVSDMVGEKQHILSHTGCRCRNRRRRTENETHNKLEKRLCADQRA